MLEDAEKDPVYEYYSSLPDDELVIDYVPLKYEVTFTPTKETAFLPTIYDLDHNSHYASLQFTFSDPRQGLSDEQLQSHEIRLLHKEEKFSKSMGYCKDRHGRRVGTNLCLIYYTPTKICLVVDFATPNISDADPQ